MPKSNDGFKRGFVSSATTRALQAGTREVLKKQGPAKAFLNNKPVAEARSRFERRQR